MMIENPSNFLMISLEKFQHLVGQVLASNTIAFTDDELPPEGTGHNKALHIQVMCNEMVVARVLIDNGSAINVCPWVTIMKLGIDQSTIRSSDITIRAFDGLKRQILGDIDLPVEIGPYTFEV